MTGEFCVASGLVLALIVFAAGDLFIASLTQVEAVQQAASTYLPYCALISALGAFPWMLDGIFIGATRTADMRNAAIVVTIIYIALDIALRPFGATGAWTAITTSYLLRGVTLLIRLPALVRDIKTVADNKKRNQTCPIHVD